MPSKIVWLTLLSLLGLAPMALAGVEPLVPLGKVNPRIRQELRYATKNNFTHQVVYNFNACYLLPEVAAALSKVQVELEKSKLGLKVWDCYRPMSAQQKFWQLVPDPRYVSPPSKGGLHTRGTAVDLTLVDNMGQEMKMPTEFDDFSPAAARRAPHTPAEALRNSQKLEAAMQRHGFVGLATEWWHYDFSSWKQHPPLKIEIRP